MKVTESTAQKVFFERGKQNPTNFLLLKVAEGGGFVPCAQGDYNVIRLLFLCGSLTSLKDNSERSSKDILSCWRTREGLTLNDSPPLDLGGVNYISYADRVPPSPPGVVLGFLHSFRWPFGAIAPCQGCWADRKGRPGSPAPALFGERLDGALQ